MQILESLVFSIMAVGALHLLVWKVLIHSPIILLCWLHVLYADWTSNEHRTHKQARICHSYLFFNLNSFNRVRYGLGLPVGLYLMISNLSALKAILLYFAHFHMACRSTRSLFPPSVEFNNILIRLQRMLLRCLIPESMSPIIIRSNGGSRTEPCGTPLLSWIHYNDIH